MIVPKVAARVGLRPPSDVKPVTSRVTAPIKVSTEESKVQKASLKRASTIPEGPKSVSADEVDDIYKEEDPIAVTIERRKKAGSLSSTVKDPNVKSGKFFYTLRLKGTIEISEQAKENAMKQKGLMDEAGNITDDKPQADPIDKSLKSRVKDGKFSHMTTIKEAKQAEPDVFKFKLKGGQPELAQPKKDPSTVASAQESSQGGSGPSLNRLPSEKAGADPIDKSLKTRVTDGKFNHMTTVKDPKTPETNVFKLKLKGGQPVLMEAAKDPEELKAASLQPPATDTKE